MSLESCLTWAGKPETGLHLDVMKDNKLIQKIMIDEKDHYIFGRNPDLNEFCLNHASCSRQHAALIYHKHLKRFFLIDLNSRYGSFIGKTKLETNKPTQILPDTQFSFGESTRYFILREKPVQLQISKKTDSVDNETLPENEQELSNLTDFNTAHNKRIISLLRVGDTTDIIQRGTKRKKKAVNFKDEEDIINPYDIDDSIGKFSNLVQTTVIPNKRFKSDSSYNSASTSSKSDSSSSSNNKNSYDFKNNSFLSESLSSKLNFNLPNSAPAVDFTSLLNENLDKPIQFSSTNLNEQQLKYKSNEKKKYAKEAWPGRKPNL